MVKVNQLIKDKHIKKLSNGVNIFNAMKAEWNKDQTLRKFTLDFANVSTCSAFVFREIIKQMQARLKGQFNLELINANPIISATFKMVIANK